MNAVTLAQHGTNGMLVPIPDEHVGRLIGKQGVTIKNIQDRCRVRCILPQQADPGSFPPTRTITVQGDPSGQAMAKYEIESIIYNQQIQLGQTPTVYPQAPAGMAPAAAPYGGGMGMYGGAAGGMYSGYPQQQQQYAQQYAAAAAAQAQVQTQAAPAKDHNDPTAYYTEFWQYATYYGEAAARAYYKAWSPPEGTPPPAGVVLPASASATTTPTAAAAAAAAPHVSSGDSSADGASSSSSTATTAPPSSSSTDASAPAAVADGAAPTDDLAAKEAWEKYEREMAEWKRLYGDQAASTPVALDVSAGAASTSAPAATDISGDNADASAAPLDASSA